MKKLQGLNRNANIDEIDWHVFSYAYPKVLGG